jgi:hypothetical protein
VARIGFGAVAAMAALGSFLLPSSAAAAQPGAVPPPAKGTFANVTVPGTVLAQAEDITDSGVIVGCFQRKGEPERGFIERHGTFVTIKDPAAGNIGTTCALAVNSSDVIVGEYLDKADVLHGFEDANGRFTTIDAPAAGHHSGQGTVAVDINDAGVIAGWYITGKQVQHGFVRKGGKFIVISDPAAGKARFQGTGLVGIADNGTIAGSYTDTRNHQHGFWLRQGMFHRVDVRGAANTIVACISDRDGLLVGEYQTGARKSFVGFTDDHGLFRSLRDPAARSGTFPQCGNDLGKVVGYYVGAKNSTRAFKFTPGKASPAARAGGPRGPGTAPAPALPLSRLP